VREQATIIVDRLRRSGAATFRALVSDCETTLLIVGRFLALLELFREGVVSFEQVTPLGDLTVRWTGGDTTEVDIGEDQYGPSEDADGALAVAETVGQPRDDDSDSDQGRGTDNE
jgi:segregation and condensation protein A